MYGRCVCSQDIKIGDESFTLVNDDGKKRALEELNSTLTWVRAKFLEQIK